VNLDIFPNPARDIVTVRADLTSDDPVALKIISGTGKEIFTGVYTVSKGYFEQQFDMRYLPEGVYLVKLAVGSRQSAVGKVVLMH
jgi:hypothetical protein